MVGLGDWAPALSATRERGGAAQLVRGQAQAAALGAELATCLLGWPRAATPRSWCAPPAACAWCRSTAPSEARSAWRNRSGSQTRRCVPAPPGLVLAAQTCLRVTPRGPWLPPGLRPGRAWPRGRGSHPTVPALLSSRSRNLLPLACDAAAVLGRAAAPAPLREREARSRRVPAACTSDSGPGRVSVSRKRGRPAPVQAGGAERQELSCLGWVRPSGDLRVCTLRSSGVCKARPLIRKRRRSRHSL